MSVPKESPLQAIIDLSQIFNDLCIPYFIGGSFASSVHGEFRTTNNIDIVCDFPVSISDQLSELLEKDFILDSVLLKRSIQEKTTFNIIHDKTFIKIDIFHVKSSFHKEELKRAEKFSMPGPEFTFYIATSEDILLSKLDWYRRGGEVSDRQWRDVVSIIKIQGKNLDMDYVKQWSKLLGIDDLLNQAMDQK